MSSSVLDPSALLTLLNRETIYRRGVLAVAAGAAIGTVDLAEG